MRTPSIASVAYAPGIPPADGADFRRFMVDELQKIQAAIALLSAGHVDKVTVAPLKPREGDIRLADGINWDPGAGAGVYAYYGGAWNKLG